MAWAVDGIITGPSDPQIFGVAVSFLVREWAQRLFFIDQTLKDGNIEQQISHEV